ncbi:DUF6891 domain-containing protein, partial [Saccharothrix hoggarensis]
MVEQVDDVPEEVAEEVEEHARGLVHGGFSTFDEVLEDVLECFEDEGAVTPGHVRAVVERLWRERAAEQEGWPATTDVDRLLAVFEALDADGIVARPDFTCCQTCGVAEIGDEAGEAARGYVFFHRQDTESAAAGGGLFLAYGPLADSPDHAAAAAAVGREVVAALTA